MANELKKYNLKMSYSFPAQCAGNESKTKLESKEGCLYNLKRRDEEFGSYLAGLFEGDGYISINNKNKLIFAITFNIKDKPLALKILNKIGIGHISKRKSKSVELRFTAKTSL
jgi:hypothetical protein